MEPNGVSILVIQNPGEAATTIVAETDLSVDGVIEQYGGQIKQGAFVSLTAGEGNGEATGEIFVADRVGDSLYLQSNEFLGEDDAPEVDTIGSVVSAAHAPLTEELETFTVFGVNDDGEKFVAVISATEETAESIGVQAGLVNTGCEHFVRIAAIVKGNQTDLEFVTA